MNRYDFTDEEYYKFMRPSTDDIDDSFYITKYFGEFITEALKEAFGNSYNFSFYEKERIWYTEWENHKRKLISTYAQKGYMYYLYWGWNYDFIPVYRDGKFRYARTEKSFRTCICDDYMCHLPPGTFNGDSKHDYHIYHRYELTMWSRDMDFARRCCKNVTLNNVPFMLEFFDRIKTDPDVISELERITSDSDSINHQTLAFLYAKNGDMNKAKEKASAYFGNDIPEKFMKKLTEVNDLD